MPTKQDYSVLRILKETLARFQTLKFAYESTHLQKVSNDFLMNLMMTRLAEADPATGRAIQTLNEMRSTPDGEESETGPAPAPEPQPETP